MNKSLVKAGRILLSVLFWIAVWALAAKIYGVPLIFPSPLAVIRTWISLLGTKEFYLLTLRSIANILAGTLAAVVIASLLAFLTHTVPFLHDLVFPLLTVIKATPVASFIILAWLWMGNVRVPAFITALMVLPVVWTNLDEGLRKIDPQLSEVARVYRFSFFKRLRLLVFPSVFPYFLSACRTAFGLAWKAGIAAEIIASPPGTIGSTISNARQYGDYLVIFAWTLTVILLSLVFEILLSQGLRRLAERLPGKESAK